MSNCEIEVKSSDGNEKLRRELKRVREENRKLKRIISYGKVSVLETLIEQYIGLSVRLISISDIPLINYEPVAIKMNPYTDVGYFESRTHEKAIKHITAPYRPIWNRQGGKCKYCGRLILPDQKRSLVPINLSAPMSFENLAYVHEVCKENELDYIGYMENPHDLRTADVMRLLEEVARIRENRRHGKISFGHFFPTSADDENEKYSRHDSQKPFHGLYIQREI